MSSASAACRDAFYVVAREAGHEQKELPAWADRRPGNITFDPAPEHVAQRRDIDAVPGAFQLLHVLTDAECAQFVAISDALGYHHDAPVSLPHHVRHNTNVNWVVDESVDGPDLGTLPFADPGTGGGCTGSRTERAIPLLSLPGRGLLPPPHRRRVAGEPGAGRTPRPRCVRRPRQPDVDAALPERRLHGGRTLFYVRGGGDGAEAKAVGVATPKGAALCFPHGFHPLHCLHAGEPVSSGTKYIIRTDVLFGLPGTASPA